VYEGGQSRKAGILGFGGAKWQEFPKFMDCPLFLCPKGAGIIPIVGYRIKLTIKTKASIMIPKWYRRCAMPGLLIKDIPREVHEWLKREAKTNRRSMTQHAIFVFEERMRRFRPLRFPPPARTRTLLTAEFIDQAKREGRR